MAPMARLWLSHSRNASWLLAILGRGLGLGGELCVTTQIPAGFFP